MRPKHQRNWRTLMMRYGRFVLGAIAGWITAALLISDRLLYQQIGGAILVFGMLGLSFWIIHTGDSGRKAKRRKRR